MEKKVMFIYQSPYYKEIYGENIVIGTSYSKARDYFVKMYVFEDLYHQPELAEGPHCPYYKDYEALTEDEKEDFFDNHLYDSRIEIVALSDVQYQD